MLGVVLALFRMHCGLFPCLVGVPILMGCPLSFVAFVSRFCLGVLAILGAGCLFISILKILANG